MGQKVGWAAACWRQECTRGTGAAHGSTALCVSYRDTLTNGRTTVSTAAEFKFGKSRANIKERENTFRTYSCPERWAINNGMVRKQMLELNGGTNVPRVLAATFSFQP